jgi:hypothetical protein
MRISAVCNFHREAIALPSFIRHAEEFFDELVFVSSPPDGVDPCEESIEIIKQSGHKLHHFTVSKGFGVLRTRCLQLSKGDWTMILDADEIMAVKAPRMTCEGTEKYPEIKEPKLTLSKGVDVDQKAQLLDLIARAERVENLCICLSRRHWFDGPKVYERPCQNFSAIPDWQLRFVKRSPMVFYDPEWRVHEKLLLATTWAEPPYIRGDGGPYIDHHHCFYKPQDPEKNKLDMEVYRKLDLENTKGMWLEEAAGVKP